MSTIKVRNYHLISSLSLILTPLSSIFYLILFAFYFLNSPAAASNSPSKTIAITQIVDHSSLDQARSGFLKALEDLGYRESESFKIIYQNAQGNPTTASQIAQQFVTLKPDLIVAISTPSAQAALKSSRDAQIPVIFISVTDPEAAGLLQASYNLTGCKDFPPLKEGIDLMIKAIPHLRKLGVLYAPGRLTLLKRCLF